MPQDTKADVQLTKVFLCCLVFLVLVQLEISGKKRRIFMMGNRVYQQSLNRIYYIKLSLNKEPNRQSRSIKKKSIRLEDDSRGFPFKLADRVFTFVPTQRSSEITKRIFFKLCNHKCAIHGPEILRNIWKI